MNATLSCKCGWRVARTMTEADQARVVLAQAERCPQCGCSELIVSTMTITEASKAVFINYAKDAGNWSGTPLVGGNVGGTKEERGNLTQLKRAGLITTFETHDGPGHHHTWINFTEAGRAFAAELGIDLEG